MKLNVAACNQKKSGKKGFQDLEGLLSTGSELVEGADLELSSRLRKKEEEKSQKLSALSFAALS